MKQRSTPGLIVVGRRRHIGGDGVVGKDQGASVCPWVAVARPEMAQPRARRPQRVATTLYTGAAAICHEGLAVFGGGKLGYGFHDLR